METHILTNFSSDIFEESNQLLTGNQDVPVQVIDIANQKESSSSFNLLKTETSFDKINSWIAPINKIGTTMGTLDQNTQALLINHEWQSNSPSSLALSILKNGQYELQTPIPVSSLGDFAGPVYFSQLPPNENYNIRISVAFFGNPNNGGGVAILQGNDIKDLQSNLSQITNKTMKPGKEILVGKPETDSGTQIHMVELFNPKKFLAGEKKFLQGDLRFSQGLKIDNNKFLIACDYGNRKLYKVNPETSQFESILFDFDDKSHQWPGTGTIQP